MRRVSGIGFRVSGFGSERTRCKIIPAARYPIPGILPWSTFILGFILHTSYFINPAKAYWQQRVSYDIRVTLIDSVHTLDGSLSVVYTNNSPDTLREVWFHLYSDAFQRGSMMDERALAIHTPRLCMIAFINFPNPNGGNIGSKT
ncbi:MAG TPA: hypothetical protein VFD13_00645 [Candidatus Kapabacteria bacterium]|nr:hypothetical protein [Candidatus Kapabacteria bacterium]